MSYKVFISKKIDKFINSLTNSKAIRGKLTLLENFKSEQKLNLDIKSMKGNWRGYYRIRFGSVRFIFRIIDDSIVFIEEANYRGKIYK